MRFGLLATLYGLTGLTGVAYEILWARMMSLQFGVSVFAVVLTVATFMAGLGAGSLIITARLPRIKRPLLMLALLEGGIACYALILPYVLKSASVRIEHAAATLSLGEWYALIAAASGVLLFLPAFAMGAGFPAALSAGGGEEGKLARLYGLNTLGASLGALLPLWLLPMLGWSGGIRLVAIIGLAGAAGLLALAYGEYAPDKVHPAAKRPPWRALGAYAGIGAASLMLEIAWTRLYGMVMLRTEYVLAVILAAFLAGIGLGSLVAPRLKRRAWFSVLPVVAGSMVVIGLWLLPAFSAWIERTEFSSLLSAMSLQGMLLFLTILPVTLAMGAWLPLLNNRLGGGGMWLYGANSLGACAGAIFAGLLLIPHAGSEGTVVWAALALLTAGLIWSHSRIAWLAVPLLALAAWPVYQLPPVSKLLPQAEHGSRNLYVYEDAVSMTHVVEQANGQRLLLTDLQRMDASTDPTAVFVQANQARLPLLLQGEAHSVLFLGLGTGISVSGSLPFPGLQRTAVELSRGSIRAASRWFEPANGDAMQKTKVVHDDARHFLEATHDKYDVIIGDVFHPDMAGMSALLSLQQFRRARSRLTPNGLFVQWLAINQFDPASLNVILRTFHRAYPNAQLFLDGMHLAMVGPRNDFAGATGVIRYMLRLKAKARAAATAGQGGWTWLGRYWGPIPDTAGPVQDEWAPVIEFSLPRARYSRKLDVAATLQALLQMRPDMNQADALLGVPEGEREDFERAYGATELLARSWVAEMHGDEGRSQQLMRMAYQANPQDRWVTYALADSMFATLSQARAMGLSEQEALQRILKINPWHSEALRALWHLQRAHHEPQAEATRLRLLAVSPLDREARGKDEIGLP